ncbi:MAG: TatD family hydrolase [Candidatus Shapirobacteria bacterium]
MIDTHSHIATGIEGLEFVVLSGSNLEDSKNNILLAKNNNKLLAAIGIHPQETGNIEELEKMMCDEVVAVGECGLDFSEEHDKNIQISLFKKQIELSQKYSKALIIHSRKAAEETLEILKKYKNLRGVIHCYTGGKKRIKNYLDISDNWYFGIDGNLTYEDGLVEVVKNIPKDRLILETDSPYLTPVPFRGSENRPKYVKYIYQKVADIWGMSFGETEKIVDANARKLFCVQSP